MLFRSEVAMLIMLRPPLINPTSAEAKAINLLEIPALFIIDPARINKGIAINGNFIDPSNITIAVSIRKLVPVFSTIAMVLKTGTSFLIDTAIVMFDGSMKFPLIAIPLFILAGSIMNSAGISRRLIAFASALVGFIKGGLSMINIATSDRKSTRLNSSHQ